MLNVKVCVNFATNGEQVQIQFNSLISKENKNSLVSKILNYINNFCKKNNVSQYAHSPGLINDYYHHSFIIISWIFSMCYNMYILCNKETSKHHIPTHIR